MGGWPADINTAANGRASVNINIKQEVYNVATVRMRPYPSHRGILVVNCLLAPVPVPSPNRSWRIARPHPHRESRPILFPPLSLLRCYAVVENRKADASRRAMLLKSYTRSEPAAVYPLTRRGRMSCLAAVNQPP